MSDGWAAIAAALADRGDAEAGQAALAAARARVWRRAAEVVREGGVVGAQIARVVAAGAIGGREDPVWLACVLGLFATRQEAAAWLGPLPSDGPDYAAAFRRAAAESRRRAEGRGDRSGPP